jgi:hypothetical protein
MICGTPSIWMDSMAALVYPQKSVLSRKIAPIFANMHKQSIMFTLMFTLLVMIVLRSQDTIKTMSFEKPNLDNNPGGKHVLDN